jgi:uncharacterized protein (DUF1499 family)
MKIILGPTLIAVAVVATIAAVAGVAALLLFTPLGERPLAALFRVGAPEVVDFERLKLRDTPNQFLICPPGLCAADAHAESPVFEVPVEELRDRWRRVVGAQPRVALLREDGAQADYVERSKRFRFPDIVTVRFVALAPSKSTLAIYSRSLYGKSDLGVNRKRIEAWLARLSESP